MKVVSAAGDQIAVAFKADGAEALAGVVVEFKTWVVKDMVTCGYRGWQSEPLLLVKLFQCSPSEPAMIQLHHAVEDSQDNPHNAYTNGSDDDIPTYLASFLSGHFIEGSTLHTIELPIVAEAAVDVEAGWAEAGADGGDAVGGDALDASAPRASVTIWDLTGQERVDEDEEQDQEQHYISVHRCLNLTIIRQSAGW